MADRLYNNVGINKHFTPADLPQNLNIKEVEITCTFFLFNPKILNKHSFPFVTILIQNIRMTNEEYYRMLSHFL